MPTLVEPTSHPAGAPLLLPMNIVLSLTVVDNARLLTSWLMTWPQNSLFSTSSEAASPT